MTNHYELIEDKIYEILNELIPLDGVEIIYTDHYTLHIGYDSKHHLLMIRDGTYCYCGHERDFDLDTYEIINRLEKDLPVKVEYDGVIIIQEGKTHKFYITIEE